jgi:hypothetical protein
LKVFRVTNKETKEVLAMKRMTKVAIVIDLIVCYCISFQFLLFWIIFYFAKANMTKEDVEAVQVEIAILKKVG